MEHEEMRKKNQLVFLDVSLDGDPIEKMVFELFYDVAPNTAENFRALCTGEKGHSSSTGMPLHYKGTFFHRIIRGCMAQAGDLLRHDGKSGESIYREKFPDEKAILFHDKPGLLTMAIADRDSRGSLFGITFNAYPQFDDGKHIVFGKIVKGLHILSKIEKCGDGQGKPHVTVKILKCGEHQNEDHNSVPSHAVKRKASNLRDGKDGSSESNSHEMRHKRNKRSSESPSFSFDTSINPRTSSRRSPEVSPKRSVSRSPSFSGSPQRAARGSRGFSRSPIRSGSSPARSVSRSPIIPKKERSIIPPSVWARPRRDSSRTSSSSLPQRSPSTSPPRTSSRKPESRSPIGRGQRYSYGRGYHSSDRSPIRPYRGGRSEQDSPSPPRTSSRKPESRSPIGRGQRYSYGRGYHSSDRSPIRPYRGGRSEQDMSKKNSFVFLDVSIDGDPREKMVFELFYDNAPKTAENFRSLCTGERGDSKTGIPLHYKGTFFHSIIRGSMAQAGDLKKTNGKFGESIYGENFPYEKAELSHTKRGLLTMAIADCDSRGSLFGITFKENPDFDGKRIVFGKLVEGSDVLTKIEKYGDEGKPAANVKIINCGKHPRHGSSSKSSTSNSQEYKRVRQHRKGRKVTYEFDSLSDSDQSSSSPEF